MHTRKLVLLLCVSAAFVADACLAQQNPVMMRRNAENTLGSLGANRAKSMMCAFRSPWAPEPARLESKRQTSGVSGPPQS